LQTLAASGLIPFSSAVFVLFGMNIGTCITAVLASIGTNRSAKRTTIIHLMFNIIGTIVFTTLCLLLPIADIIHMDILRQELERMIHLAGANVERCFNAILDNNPVLIHEAEETEGMIDTLNKDISQYISKILVNSSSDANVTSIEQYFVITGNVERIGDHAMNVGEYLETIRKKNIVFSEGAQKEIGNMRDITQKAIEKVMKKEEDIAEWLSEIAAMEQQIDDMTNRYRERHLERMRQGLCSEEACILYSELLTDFERIGDHVLNIAQARVKIDA